RYKFLLFLNEILFLGEKKAQQSHKDCAWHISSFIVNASFLSRNDLKPENPKGHQAALNF
ncbi:hypothetical protein, partial [Acinetobacter baumannii]|uniref:hypothetical protein n=1 Tax=Acinetobacter baumannii TaxID=470 RepID=UPI002740632A